MKQRIVIFLDDRLISLIEREARDRGISIDKVIEEKLKRSFGR